MTAKISWELRERGVLRLTVTDGPKETHYTLRRNHSIETIRDVLGTVFRELGGITVDYPPQPLSVAPVPSAQERLERSKPVGWLDRDGVMHPYTEDQEEQLDQEIHSPLPMTEEESLAQLKRMAWEMAQKNLGFHRGELPDDTAAMLSRMPAHEKFGQNPGLPTLAGGGVTAVDGTYIDPAQFRAKPQFNLDNHED